MSEEKLWTPKKIYDKSKHVSLDINLSYIEGLDNIIKYFIINVIDDISTIPQTFENFKAILTGQYKDKPKLSEKETMLFVLYSLSTDLKIKAGEDNYYTEEAGKTFEHKDVIAGVKSLLNEEESDNEKVKEFLSYIEKSNNKKSS